MVDNIRLKNWGQIKMLKIKDNVDLKELEKYGFFDIHEVYKMQKEQREVKWN